MKKILLIFALFSITAYSQEPIEDLEKSANNVLDLGKKEIQKEIKEIKNTNVMNLPEKEFKVIHETFLKNFGKCTHNIQTFKMSNGEKGRISVRGFVKKKNRKGINERFCEISLEVRPDFTEFCSYPEDSIVELYGYYALDFFEKGKENSRYGLKHCRRFY